ncbi:MAG: RNA methyltransferase [Acidobacteriota bacterium]
MKSKGDWVALEGPHLILEALQFGLVLEHVLMTPAFAEREEGRHLAARTTVLLVAEPVLASLADADAPQGALAVARIQRSGVAALPRRVNGVYVYAEGMQDPGNLGALARSAEAAGATALALSPGAASPNQARALRASAGSLLRFPLAVQVTPQDLTLHLTDLRPRWVALDPSATEDLYSADLGGPLVLMLGAEGPGLSADSLALADVRLRIPVSPPVESLNATVAAAVVLFEIFRRRG